MKLELTICNKDLAINAVPSTELLHANIDFGKVLVVNASQPVAVKDFFNVTEAVPPEDNFYTLEQAIAAVPEAQRKEGLVITYKGEDRQLEGGSESFDNAPTTGTAYQTADFEGDTHHWSFERARTDLSITERAITLGRSQSPQSELFAVTESGIGMLKFDYMQPFTTNVNLNILVNDEIVGNVTTNNELNVVKHAEILVDAQGICELKFKSVFNSSGQVTIDNIEWDGYTESNEPLWVIRQFAGTIDEWNDVEKWVAISGDAIPKDLLNDIYIQLGNKVDKVSGKGLSTNDFTTEAKNKLNGIAAGAQVNVIETVKVDGVALPVQNKAVDIVGKVSDVPVVESNIVQTNQIFGDFIVTGLSADDTLYFGSSGVGIYKLDSNGNIVPTNITTGIFRSTGLSADGTLYFGGGAGVYKLDSETGNIVYINQTSGTFNAIGLSSDGILYFGRGSSYPGIYKLDNDTGNIVKTNHTSDNFEAISLSADGTLYFGSNGAGICKLNNTTGNIVPTNITTGTFFAIGLSADGTLYFVGGSNNGIYKLNNTTGTIIPTNITTGNFRSTGLSTEGTLYFGSNGAGIYKLDNNGNIVPTNITTGIFQSTGLSADGTLYFGGLINGIYKLTIDNKTFIRTHGTWVEGVAKADFDIVINDLQRQINELKQ